MQIFFALNVSFLNAFFFTYTRIERNESKKFSYSLCSFHVYVKKTAFKKETFETWKNSIISSKSSRGKTARAARNLTKFAPKQTLRPLPLLLSPSFIYGSTYIMYVLYMYSMNPSLYTRVEWLLSGQLLSGQFQKIGEFRCVLTSHAQ